MYAEGLLSLFYFWANTTHSFTFFFWQSLSSIWSSLVAWLINIFVMHSQFYTQTQTFLFFLSAFFSSLFFFFFLLMFLNIAFSDYFYVSFSIFPFVICFLNYFLSSISLFFCLPFSSYFLTLTFSSLLFLLNTHKQNQARLQLHRKE